MSLVCGGNRRTRGISHKHTHTQGENMLYNQLFSIGMTDFIIAHQKRSLNRRVIINTVENL